MLRYAKEIQKAGGHVHLLFWDMETVIRLLGSGGSSVLGAFLDNAASAEVFGMVYDKTAKSVLQAMLMKFAAGEELALFNEEVKGVRALTWKEYPEVLVLGSGDPVCRPLHEVFGNRAES